MTEKPPRILINVQIFIEKDPKTSKMTQNLGKLIENDLKTSENLLKHSKMY